MTHRYTIVAAIMTAIVLAGCQTTTGRSAGTFVDDSATTAAVKGKLVAERPANLTSIGVDTINGHVYLTGVVDTPDQRVRAEQLAWDVEGVRQVTNNIQVQRPPAASAATGTVASAPSVVRRSVVGTVSNVDAARSQVTVSTGSEQLQVELPPSVVRDVRQGDQITLDVSVRPAR